MVEPRRLDAATGLTLQQLHTMQVIQELTDASGGVPPSFEELKNEMGLSTRSAIFRLVDRLEYRGYLTRTKNHARTLTILRRVPMPDFTPYAWFPSASLAGQGEGTHG